MNERRKEGERKEKEEIDEGGKERVWKTKEREGGKKEGNEGRKELKEVRNGEDEGENRMKKNRIKRMQAGRAGRNDERKGRWNEGRRKGRWRSYGCVREC